MVAATVAAAGCSSEPKQEFAVPKSLCGVPVATDALSRVLPESGKKIAVEQDGEPSDGSVLCNVMVDGAKVLIVSTEWINPGDSASHILRSRLHAAEQKSAGGGAIAYADQAAASLIQCRRAGFQTEDVSTFIMTLKPGRTDEHAVEGVISSYTAAYKKQQPCRPQS
ncbi:hypothetical protein ACWEMW_28705 [Streptomyces sp. NPDC004684]